MLVFAHPIARGLFPCLILSLWCSSPSLGQFETRGGSAVLSSPEAIAVGDFNRDGRPDLAVTDYYNGRVAVLLGNGNGTFKAASYYNVGSNDSPSSVVAVDLRSNGTLDLAVTNRLDGNIEVLLGNGDGTFAPAISVPTNAYPNLVYVGDFNGDGIPDLVTADEGGQCPCITVLLGNGDGTFQTPINTEPPDAAVALGVGDFNQDGKLDVVTVGQFGGNSDVGVLLGNGDGTFTPGQSYATGGGPQWVAVADFNKDKKVDLAVAEPLGGAIVIFLGNGDGTFKQGQIIPASFPSSVQTGDFNGDGILDLVALSGLYGNTAITFLGRGDGTFRTGGSFPVGNESTYPAVGDFNGDHKDDFAVPGTTANQVLTLLNTGVVSFSPTTPLKFGKVKVGTTSAPLSVTLTNSGKSVLTISSMKTTGQFAETNTCGASVPAGANCSISATFSPTSTGPKSGTVTIHDSASSKPQVIELSGTGD